MIATRLAIVGRGPSCTYAMERLAATVGTLPKAAVLGVVVDVDDYTEQFGDGETCDAVFDLGAEDCPKRHLHRLALRDMFTLYDELLTVCGYSCTTTRSSTSSTRAMGASASPPQAAQLWSRTTR